MTKQRKRIDDYIINKVLGRGSMGTVYLCTDPALERPVAVKLLKHRQPEERNRTRRLRFLREALSTARLQHPGIPPVYDVRRSVEGLFYYVMKPIEGRPLQEILDGLRDEEPRMQEEFDLFRLIEILRDVCQTIQYAHSEGYIHRDLKPSNIFVGHYGEVYVIDWGLTKLLQEDSETGRAVEAAADRWLDEEAAALDATMNDTAVLDASAPGHAAAETETSAIPVDANDPLTLDGDVLGTLAYMPPEQARGRHAHAGQEMDIYALGVILYEMLTLELPIQEIDFGAFVRRKIEGEIEPPESRAPHRDVPPELSAIAMQAMAPQPEERFKQASDFNRALMYWLEGKTQFRTVSKTTLAEGDFLLLPRSARKGWEIKRETVATLPLPPETPSCLLFKREFPGDIRFSMNFLLDPVGDGEEVSEFGILLNARQPEAWKGFVRGYCIHLAAGHNTRAVLTKNDSELISNEYVVLEPRRSYRVTVEHRGADLRVMLNRQVILYYRDRNSLADFSVGLWHMGPGVTVSNFRIQTRGLPVTTSTLDVPEALMAEGCHDAAIKRFLAFASGHKNRYEGAWARYRAALAAFREDGNRKRACRILKPLQKGPFFVLERLGRARLEWEAKRQMKAARILLQMLESNEKLQHLSPVADIAFSAVQQVFHHASGSRRAWERVDAWTRVALLAGERVESHRDMMPSVLWRWLLLALTHHPDRLPDCLAFLREIFGRGQGAFAEAMTGIGPLLTILRRSASMQDHEFLMDRVMRLILHYDDNLGNLETLARFYLHSGHEKEARRIAQHIHALCRKHATPIPPMPITLLACLEWWEGDRGRAREYFTLMAEQSEEWARPDGKLLLGLDLYSRQRREEARALWRKVPEDRDAVNFNRQFIARGLRGELPADPVEAGVPNRSDHRLLYCLFLGYRFYFDWLASGDDAWRRKAVDLLRRARELQRPSYDIYSACETFVRLPLERMEEPLPPRPAPDPLTDEERQWIEELAVAASREEEEQTRRGSTSSGRPSSKARGGKRRTSRYIAPTSQTETVGMDEMKE